LLKTAVAIQVSQFYSIGAILQLSMKDIGSALHLAVAGGFVVFMLNQPQFLSRTTRYREVVLTWPAPIAIEIGKLHEHLPLISLVYSPFRIYDPR
jgi:hypothetical protein